MMSYEKNIDSIIDEIWENAVNNMSDGDKNLLFSEFTSNQLTVREVVKAFKENNCECVSIIIYTVVTCS